MGISDSIAEFIQQMLFKEDGVAELSRIELAERFGCVPSQINYVLSTRFPPEHGFIIESRRGGGGYIRIRRVRVDRSNLIMHTINAVGGEIDARTAQALLSNLADAEVLSPAGARILGAALADRALMSAPPECRDRLRAGILKQCLLKALQP